MANPQETVTPSQLIHGPNGWEGHGEYFGVYQNVIKIKNSDAQSSHVPSAEQRLGRKDEKGNFSLYERVANEDYIFQLWMNRIGPYLADWVLEKNSYGTFFPLRCFLTRDTDEWNGR